MVAVEALEIFRFANISKLEVARISDVLRM